MAPKLPRRKLAQRFNKKGSFAAFFIGIGDNAIRYHNIEQELTCDF
jgi:hypothetical protein